MACLYHVWSGPAGAPFVLPGVVRVAFLTWFIIQDSVSHFERCAGFGVPRIPLVSFSHILLLRKYHGVRGLQTPDYVGGMPPNRGQVIIIPTERKAFKE